MAAFLVSFAPAVNPTLLWEGIVTILPAWGPSIGLIFLGLTCLTENEPNPVKTTLSPLINASSILERTAFKASSPLAVDVSKVVATLETISAFLKFAILYPASDVWDENHPQLIQSINSIDVSVSEHALSSGIRININPLYRFANIFFNIVIFYLQNLHSEVIKLENLLGLC